MVWENLDCWNLPNLARLNFDLLNLVLDFLVPHYFVFRYFARLHLVPRHFAVYLLFGFVLELALGANL